MAARGFSLVGFSLVVVCGFSLFSCGAWAPECVGSVVAAHGLSSCGLRARQLQRAGLVAPPHVGS